MAASGETSNSQPTNPWRRSLKTAVAGLLTEIGYQSAEILAIETLVEMVQAYMTELGRYSSSLAELASRTKVMPSDAVLAIMDSGLDIRGMATHARRENKTTFQAPPQSAAVPSSKVLQVGEKRKHPSHIPDYLPAFPDPHTYIKTPSFRQPNNEYQLIRERAASQKRDVEVGLTRFIAKTGETHALFKDDKSAFPMIACKPTSLPYLDALLPKANESQEPDKSEHETKMAPKKQSGIDGTLNKDPVADQDTIDNPYLCPVKMSKRINR